MLHLSINGLPAAINPDFSFTLTRENPLFTDSGDFTLEVELPLSGCPQNVRIFGALHRKDVSKLTTIGKPMPFTLSALPVYIKGTAVITSVTEKQVKVQLLAGRSALNAAFVDEKGNDRYVDELDLGTPFDHWFDHQPTEEEVREQLWKRWKAQRKPIGHEEDILYATPNHQPYILYPIYSTADENIANDIEVEKREGGFYYRLPQAVEKKWENEHGRPIMTTKPLDKLAERFILAPQPYLWHVVERVMRALGFELSANDNALRREWMGKVFLANARNTIQIAKMLPHWTVKEFVQQVQLFASVVVSVDGKRATVTEKLFAFNRYTEYLKKVVEGYAVEMEADGGQKDPTKANVAYQFDKIHPRLSLTQDIRDVAAWRDVDTATPYLDIQPTNEERKNSNVIYRNKVNGFSYAFFKRAEEDYRLDVIDPMGARWGNAKKEIDIALKIVPVALETMDNINEKKYAGKEWKPTTLPKRIVLATDQATTAPTSETVSIDKVLYEEQKAEKKESNTKNTIEVAYAATLLEDEQIYDFNDKTRGRIHNPTGIPYLLNGRELRQVADNLRFLLNFKGKNDLCIDIPQSGMAQTLFASYAPVDTRAEWHVDFLDVGNFTIANTFLIRGRKYLCKSIQYTITAQGINPVKKGVFYEISE